MIAAAPRLAAAGVRTWLPDLEAVRLCCDKAAFAERMQAAGVRHSRTAATPAEVVDVPGSLDRQAAGGARQPGRPVPRRRLAGGRRDGRRPGADRPDPPRWS